MIEDKKELFTHLFFEIKPALENQIKQIPPEKLNDRSSLNEIEKLFIILYYILDK